MHAYIFSLTLLTIGTGAKVQKVKAFMCGGLKLQASVNVISLSQIPDQ